jgi:L-ribulose-5-phosphate 3-epimerase
MMKTGIYQGCFATSLDMARCVRLASELGFDGLEVTMEDPEPLSPEAKEESTQDILAIGRSVGMTTTRDGALTLNSSEAEIQEIGLLAQEAGTRIHSIATMMLFFYPLSSRVPTVRDKGIDITLKILQAASTLGADTVLVIPGLVTPSVGYREAYRRSQSVIRDLETEARRLGVVLAIENVWNRFLLSPLEMARYLDELGSEYVGAYFDVANVMTFGYPADWLRELGHRVKGIHFKDFRQDIDNILGFTHLLHGDVDWHAVVGALREITYQGYVTVEVPPLKTHPENGPRDAKTSLDLILNSYPD